MCGHVYVASANFIISKGKVVGDATGAAKLLSRRRSLVTWRSAYRELQSGHRVLCACFFCVYEVERLSRLDNLFI